VYFPGNLCSAATTCRVALEIIIHHFACNYSLSVCVCVCVDVRVLVLSARLNRRINSAKMGKHEISRVSGNNNEKICEKL
jgi:hypothetical protein